MRHLEYMQNGPILSEFFQVMFQPVIRVHFPWERFRTEQWPVDLTAVTARSALAALYLPWHVRAGAAVSVAFDHPQALPLQVGDFPEVMTNQPPDRQVSLRLMEARMREYRYPQVLVAPAADLPDGQAVLLDGCHHLVGALLADVAISLAVFTVHPPADAGIPDLDVLRAAHFRGD